MRRFLTLALSFLGLFDSIYLWWVYASPAHSLVCLGTGCDVVRASQYSHVWGMPTPFYGACMYGGLALLAFAEPLAGKLLGTAIRYVILFVAAVAFGISCVLSFIEAFKLHSWCAWCVLSAIIVTLILILSASRVRSQARPTDTAKALNAVRAQFALFVVALIVGIVAFARLSRSSQFARPAQVSAATLKAHLVRPDSLATGNLASPVTVVEFGDFECPMCRLAQRTVKKILNQYGTKIRFVFRQFPMDLLNPKMHPQAESAAEASECAAAQGKFWQAEDLFFKNQDNLSVAALEKYAAQLGINTAKFDQCLTSGEMAGRVKQDFEDGKAAGVRGTPTFFVGHEMFEGVPSFATLSYAIDQQLARAAPGTSQGAKAQASSLLQPSGSPNAKTTPASSQPASSSSAGSIPPPNGGNPFSLIQSSNPLACTANEADMVQPSLIRTAEARELYEGHPKPLFVDVRSEQKYASAHIAGAINIPVEKIEEKWSSLPRNRVIVFYQGSQGANGDVCAFSRAAARVLLQHGYPRSRVKVYLEGLKGWQKSGLPVAK